MRFPDCSFPFAATMTASVLGLMAQAPAAEPWKFVSIPDFLNVDVGDLTQHAPGYTGPNSTSASWESAIGYVLDRVKDENPDFVAVAGDMVMARWYDDANYQGIFGPKVGSSGYSVRDLATEQQRVRNAADLYYGTWKKRLDDRGLTYYAAVGDHELGDDPSWADDFGKQTVTTYRQKFSQHFVQPLGSVYSAPAAGQHAGSAYAVRHKNTLLVTVDVFKQNSGLSITPTVDGEQLTWLQQTLDQANADPTIEHVIVQGHTPVLGPVNQRVSSGLMLQGGAGSAFWRTLGSADADLYLAGEVHDITVSQRAGESLFQIAHGGLIGWSEAQSQNYLVGTVYGNRIDLELKSIGVSVSGGQLFQPGNPTTRIKNTVTLDTAGGFKTIGKVTLDKSGGQTRFIGGTGAFASLVTPPATLASNEYDATGTGASFVTNSSAVEVAANVEASPFSATGVGLFQSGTNNFGRFATGQFWPGTDPFENDASAFDESKYVGFELSAEPGFEIASHSLSVEWNRGGPKAPNDAIVRVSVDGFDTWSEYLLFSNAATTETDTQVLIDLSSLEAATNVAFRFYFKDQDLSGAQAAARLDDVTFYGWSVASVPEPASAALLAVAAPAVLRRRRRL
jgi:hypothetical protein